MITKIKTFFKKLFLSDPYEVPEATEKTHKRCPLCEGSGRDDIFHDCKVCNGTGIVKKSFTELHNLFDF
jgi:DnaJ-class molecular chaperone